MWRYFSAMMIAAHHRRHRNEQHRQIDDPLIVDRNTERAAQQIGHHKKARGEHGMQREYADVEPQQLAVVQHGAEQGRHGLGVAMHAETARRRHHEFGNRHP
jgi:hypothetical protein